MNITMNGETLALEGVQPEVGQTAPDFKLENLQDEWVSLSEYKGKPVIISVVPDIDTSVCALQTKRFNQEAASKAGIAFLTISNNTKDQQKNWCAAEGVSMTMLRDTDLAFAKAYGIYIPTIQHLARAIFVVDAAGKIVYEEIVSELTHEPDYQKALAVAEAAK